MSPNDMRKRVAELLLEEVLVGKLRWWYISMANEKDGFVGGVFLEARGPTEAWRLLHGLGLYPRDRGAETLTFEVPAEKVHFIKDEIKYKVLSKADLKAMDEFYLEHPDRAADGLPG